MSAIVIGPGNVNFKRRWCARAAYRASVCVHAALAARSGAAHRRHHRLVAVVADAHLDLVLEVDAVDAFEEAMHEMLTRLLAVADDVEAGVFLDFEPAAASRRACEAGQELRRSLGISSASAQASLQARASLPSNQEAVRFYTEGRARRL